MWMALPAAAQSGPAANSEFVVGGYPGAPITIEVFSDYQCPACRTFYLQTIRPVLTDYARFNKVCVIYHDFPLQMHAYSRKAARYALAARRIGREEWMSVTDALYSSQMVWSENGDVEKVVAGALSPKDMTRVKEMLGRPEIEKTIDSEIALARARGVNSTPTFFLAYRGREQRAVGGVSYNVLKDYLDRLLK